MIQLHGLLPKGGCIRGLLLILLGGLLCAGALGAEVPEAISYCLDCHGDEEFSMELEDGAEMSLYVTAEAFAGSVHGPELVCTDCHLQYDEDHPTGATFPDIRQYVIGSYDMCKTCHFDTYTRTLESVHYEHLKEGSDSVPVCTDCHGAHDIQNPHEKQAMISKSCASCHVEIYEQYAHSVHGKALVEEDNRDVPGCADCHTHHDIEHPSTARFRLASPTTCVRCHGDEEMMATYGISPDVAITYLSDFHGVTASLADVSEVDPKQVVVTCVDCHGVHDMASPRLIGSEGMKSRVEETCAKCHEGASVDFPSAWLSHYRPSLQHAPLVFLVDLFYKIFIPFVTLGLLLQVLLHLYRVAIGR
jgi:hypothetical protein